MSRTALPQAELDDLFGLVLTNGLEAGSVRPRPGTARRDPRLHAWRPHHRTSLDPDAGIDAEVLPSYVMITAIIPTGVVVSCTT